MFLLYKILPLWMSILSFSSPFLQPPPPTFTQYKVYVCVQKPK